MVAGARVTVQVTARAATNSVEALADGSARVRVTAVPADGAANQAVLRTLADTFGIPPSRLRIVSGATARRKVVEARDLTAEELAARLRRIGP